MTNNDEVMKGRRQWLDSRQAKIPPQRMTNIDELIVMIHRADNIQEAREAKQALYTRLAEEAVDLEHSTHIQSLDGSRIVKAVPLSKVKELFGVPE